MTMGRQLTPAPAAPPCGRMAVLGAFLKLQPRPPTWSGLRVSNFGQTSFSKYGNMLTGLGWGFALNSVWSALKAKREGHQ